MLVLGITLLWYVARCRFGTEELECFGYIRLLSFLE